MQNVSFKHISNNFQRQMKANIVSIKKSKNIDIFAGIKSYNKLLINDISETYKTSDSTILNTINTEAKNIAER